MKKTCIITGLLLLPQYIWAQDSVANLATIQFTETLETIDLAPLKNAKTITFSDELRSLKQYQNMEQFLQQQTSIYIKNNGLNSNASLNIRGSSPAQNSIVWQGVNINNAAMGAADVSTIPVGIFNNTKLILGANTAILGSGSTGGTLALSNSFYFEPKQSFTIQLHSNTIQNSGGLLQQTWSSHKWHIQTSIYGNKFNNHFKYADNGTNKWMENAHQLSGGLHTDIARLIKSTSKSKHILSGHIWLQKIDREIPKAIFETISLKNQKEQSFKSLVRYQVIRKKNQWDWKLAYFKDGFQYRDDAFLLHSQYKLQTLTSDIKWEQRLFQASNKRWDGRFMISLPIQYYTISSSNIKENVVRLASVASIEFWTINKLTAITINARQEWNNRLKAPFVPQLIMKQIIFKSGKQSLLAKSSFQKTYRLPTLNEWYYFPGGNINLKPEQGWSYEGGLMHFMQHEKWDTQLEFTYFQRVINDWIYWHGGAIWTPHNIAQVTSKGLEATFKTTYFFSKNLSSTFSWNTTFAQAITTRSLIPEDKSMGKQIPYSPKLIHQGSLTLKYKNWTWLNQAQYIGYRFTTNDESNYLPKYWQLQTQLQKSWIKKKHQLNTSIYVENWSNTDYQVVYGRPMPPIHVGLQIQYSWH